MPSLSFRRCPFCAGPLLFIGSSTIDPFSYKIWRKCFGCRAEVALVGENIDRPPLIPKGGSSTYILQSRGDNEIKNIGVIGYFAPAHKIMIKCRRNLDYVRSKKEAERLGQIALDVIGIGHRMDSLTERLSSELQNTQQVIH
jgi:hypothetical protein